MCWGKEGVQGGESAVRESVVCADRCEAGMQMQGQYKE